MIFATIKKCGGVKWRFHIQRGKGGFTSELGWLQLEVGGDLFLSSQLPTDNPLAQIHSPHRHSSTPKTSSRCSKLRGAQVCIVCVGLNLA